MPTKTTQQIVEEFKKGPMGFNEYVDAMQEIHKHHARRLDEYLDEMEGRLRSVPGLVGQSLEALENMRKADTQEKHREKSKDYVPLPEPIPVGTICNVRFIENPRVDVAIVRSCEIVNGERRYLLEGESALDRYPGWYEYLLDPLPNVTALGKKTA